MVEVVLAGESASVRAGRDDETVETEDRSVDQAEFTRAQVERRRGLAKAPLDVEIVEDIGLAEVDAVGLPLARQHLLRQRRTIVGSVRFVSDDHDRTRDIVLTQRLCRSKACE